MRRFKQKKLLLCLSIVPSLCFQISEVNAGSFGAEIFCTMRSGGNDHESSWDAAYTYIKKQKGGLFKVSPMKQQHKLLKQLSEIKNPSPIVLNILINFIQIENS